MFVQPFIKAPPLCQECFQACCSPSLEENYKDPGEQKAACSGLWFHSLLSPQALSCSSFVPFFSGLIPPSFRGVVSPLLNCV